MEIQIRITKSETELNIRFSFTNRSIFNTPKIAHLVPLERQKRSLLGTVRLHRRSTSTYRGNPRGSIHTCFPSIPAIVRRQRVRIMVARSFSRHYTVAVRSFPGNTHSSHTYTNGGCLSMRKLTDWQTLFAFVKQIRPLSKAKCIHIGVV